MCISVIYIYLYLYLADHIRYWGLGVLNMRDYPKQPKDQGETQAWQEAAPAMAATRKARPSERPRSAAEGLVRLILNGPSTPI